MASADLLPSLRFNLSKITAGKNLKHGREKLKRKKKKTQKPANPHLSRFTLRCSLLCSAVSFVESPTLARSTPTSRSRCNFAGARHLHVISRTACRRPAASRRFLTRRALSGGGALPHQQTERRPSESACPAARPTHATCRARACATYLVLPPQAKASTHL